MGNTNRIADGWTGNAGGYLTIDPSRDGSLSWVSRWRADGTLRDVVGPFRTPTAARTAALSISKG